MITGTVNSYREAVISLLARGPHGQEQEIGAVIDTGFNGFLTLPPRLVSALRLTRLGFGRVVLGDGSQSLCHVFEAFVVWDGQTRNVEVDAVNTDALVGMALLERQELRIAVLTGGAVTIEALP